MQSVHSYVWNVRRVVYLYIWNVRRVVYPYVWNVRRVVYSYVWNVRRVVYSYVWNACIDALNLPRYKFSQYQNILIHDVMAIGHRWCHTVRTLYVYIKIQLVYGHPVTQPVSGQGYLTLIYLFRLCIHLDASINQHLERDVFQFISKLPKHYINSSRWVRAARHIIRWVRAAWHIIRWVRAAWHIIRWVRAAMAALGSHNWEWQLH